VDTRFPVHIPFVDALSSAETTPSLLAAVPTAGPIIAGSSLDTAKAKAAIKKNIGLSFFVLIDVRASPAP
jgi:hypothetical protein